MISPVIVPILLYTVEWTLFFLHVVPLYLKTTFQRENYCAHIQGGTRPKLFFMEVLSVSSLLGYIYWRSNYNMQRVMDGEICSVLWLQLLLVHCVLHIGYTVTTIVNQAGIVRVASEVSFRFMSILSFLFLVFDTGAHIVAILLLRSLILRDMKLGGAILGGVPAVAYFIYTIQSKRLYGRWEEQQQQQRQQPSSSPSSQQKKLD